MKVEVETRFFGGWWLIVDDKKAGWFKDVGLAFRVEKLLKDEAKRDKDYELLKSICRLKEEGKWPVSST
jgi:hypothetical protein